MGEVHKWEGTNQEESNGISACIACGEGFEIEQVFIHFLVYSFFCPLKNKKVSEC